MDNWYTVFRSPWINEEDGGPVMGLSFNIPGNENLVASVALKSPDPISEGDIQKKDARALFGHLL